MSTLHTCSCGQRWRPEGGAEADRCPACGAAVGSATLPPAAGDSSATATLPPSPSDAATLAPPTRLPGGGPTRPEGAPGYEIERELGRGGMGVVYQALDLRLKRRVALKMILAGSHAGEHELARFRTEAEAVARLQHPGIVQIHDVGVHNGLPYFALELCPGGSLDSKLDGTPLPAHEAARLVEKLARAMHAAHQKGVIHRDLKPANVLMGEDGTPKVTDFGLARKLDEAGQTRTGSIMGTPSYMAPEQAGGNKDIGPACDVYALGAILYELLTGRPPFKAATPLDTVLQVVSDEPVPPSQLQSKTPRDLETIVLKCLQKDPGKRYASAEALAEDLRRFQEGRPITARPVGQLERTWRWCRRNPALAGALAAVLLVFAGGATVSGILAVQAESARAQADQRAQEALDARNQARQEADNVRLSEERLRQTNDHLLTSVARSLLSPLAVQAQPNQPLPPLSDPEVEALWQLASAEEGELRLRFVQEAVRGPVTTRQLRLRAPYAVHAAVGLDSQRRRAVERILGGRLEAKGLSNEQRADVGLILAYCDIEDPALARRAAAAVGRFMKETNDSFALPQMAEGLSALVGRTEPKEAAAVILQAMSEPRHPDALPQLAQALAGLVTRMPAGEGAASADRAAALLSKTMSNTNAAYASLPLLQALSAVAPHLSPGAARETVVTLSAALSKTSQGYYSQHLMQGLSAVAPRLDAKGAREAADVISRAMTGPGDVHSLVNLARGLAAVASRMEPKEEAAVAARAMSLLTQTIDKASQASSLEPLGKAHSAVAPHLDARGAREAAVTITRDLARTSQPVVLSHRAQALSALASRMDPKGAREIADVLNPVLNKSASWPAQQGQLAQALSALALRMEPKEGAALLSQALSKTSYPHVRFQLTEGLSAVASRLDPKQAWEAATTLRLALSKTDQRLDKQELARALLAVAARMEPREAAAALLEAMSRTGPTFDGSSLAPGLSAIASRLEPKEAAAIAARAAAFFVRAMNEKGNPYGIVPQATGLSAVGSHLDAKGAREAATAILGVMSKTEQALAWDSLASALSVVVSRMDPGEGRAAASRAAALLTAALDKADNPFASLRLAQALSVVASRMEPKEAAAAAARAAAHFTRAMKKQNNPGLLLQLAAGPSALASRMEPKQGAALLSQALQETEQTAVLWSLAQHLSRVLARMEPKEAAAIAGRASARVRGLMTRTGDSFRWPDLAQALAALTLHLDPQEAAAAAATITEALGKTNNPGIMVPLARCLSVVASRMAPREAVAVAGRAATLVNQALGTGHTGMYQPLGIALSAFAPHLDPKAAGESAALLMNLMSKNGNPYELLPLTQTLLAVLCRADLADTSSLRTGLAATLAIAGTPGLSLTAPGLLSALVPARPPLPAQALVELLEQPCCIGPARRLVLDQLERHYYRSFADQWDFVRFAEEQRLGLDLTSPARRVPAEEPVGAATARK